MAIPRLDSHGQKGELVRPARFLPAVDWPHRHRSFAFGPIDIGSGTGKPDLSHGNYTTGWVAYVDNNNDTYMTRKIYNHLWDKDHRYLLALTSGVKKISLDFSPDGTVILGYLRPDSTMGVWWRNPDTGLPQLLDLDSPVQDMLLSVENKDAQRDTDVFLWYFKGGALYLRLHSERFATVHGPYAAGLAEPQIIQAGINHRYGYQIDYRDLQS